MKFKKKEIKQGEKLFPQKAKESISIIHFIYIIYLTPLLHNLNQI